MLALKGRIALDRDATRWVREALARPGVLARPLSPSAALGAALLGAEEFAGDPADRMIYATARELGVPLATNDEGTRRFDPRGTLW